MAPPVVSAPSGFAADVDLLPSSGQAMDLACGAGASSVWLAERGLDLLGVDGSDVAIEHARRLAAERCVAERCRFVVHDLDAGLPPSDPVDLITCHLFSAPWLDAEMIERLRPAGVLAITVLSEVDAEAGPYRAAPGELLDRFATLDVRSHREGGGTATLVAVAAGPTRSTRLD